MERANAKSMLFSCMDVLQPAATREDKFQMCKSGLLEGARGAAGGMCVVQCVMMCMCMYSGRSLLHTCVVSELEGLF